MVLCGGSVVEGDFLVGFLAFLDRESEFDFAGGFEREGWEGELVVVVSSMGRAVVVADVFYG